MPVLVSLATFVSTLLGGLFALRVRDKFHLVLGFSAGAVIGVAFFDLLPEAIKLGGGLYDASVITTTVAVGFILYMILDRFVILHSHDEATNAKRGILGAGSLSFHSFLDGVAIGVAFKVNIAVAMVVALAVLTHDFSDGINTVNIVLKNGGDRRRAFRWLILDACAPVLGVLSTLFFTLPAGALTIILSLFAGFFLYIGAIDLLPESHHGHPTAWTTAMTVIGVAVLFVVIRLANI